MKHTTPLRDRIHNMVAALWSAETSQNPEVWSAQNPPLGQCAVTACLMQDLFDLPVVRGYAILPSGDRESHYWNEAFDLTASQFPEGTTFEVREGPQGRDAHDYALTNDSTRARFEILRAAWNATYPTVNV
ncbi:YunG family protein [Loktanella sp. DJP18]|uniref:YunG family protein n=1 Tax=Loktanella sp. DJP18 TaxID=3409788 RepID=UPI003BB50D50